MEKTILQVLEEAKEVEVLEEVNGMQVVSFADFGTKAYASVKNGEPGGVRHYNPDGSIACSATKYVAVNPDYLYSNRFKVEKTKNEKDKEVTELWVVIGQTSDDAFLCIQNQDGRIPLTRIPCYVFKKGFQNKIELIRREYVSDKVFANEFKDELDKESLQKLLPLLNSDANKTKKAMPI